MEKNNSLCFTEVNVTKDDLPVICPPIGTPTYNTHPRQFLDVTKTGSAKCPYCGTLYVLVGEKPLFTEMYEGDNHVCRNESQTLIAY